MTWKKYRFKVRTKSWKYGNGWLNMLLVCFMAQTHFNGWLSVFAYPTNPVGGKEKKKNTEET